MGIEKSNTRHVSWVNRRKRHSFQEVALEMAMLFRAPFAPLDVDKSGIWVKYQILRSARRSAFNSEKYKRHSTWIRFFKNSFVLGYIYNCEYEKKQNFTVQIHPITNAKKTMQTINIIIIYEQLNSIWFKNELLLLFFLMSSAILMREKKPPITWDFYLHLNTWHITWFQRWIFQ